jgi:hypothetical protein
LSSSRCETPSGFQTQKNGVPGRHPALQPVTHRRLVPPEQAQELLQRARRRAGRVGHRFDALAVEVRKLPGDIEVQVAAGRPSTEATVRLVQEGGQRRLELQNRRGSRANNLLYP